MYKNGFGGTMLKCGTESFNPCFNGTMYKNFVPGFGLCWRISVSILVLMELCIKTRISSVEHKYIMSVSILVLMELCIKTS